MSPRKPITLEFRITELSETWLVQCTSRPVSDVEVATAAEAYARVREAVRRLGEIGVSSIALIDWRPRTRVGRMVAKAIVAESAAKRAPTVKTDK